MAVLALVASPLFAAEFTETTKADQPKIAEASLEAENAIKKFKLAPGLKMELFAAEPFLANPVAFAPDEKGRWYVVETFRHTENVLDIRGRMHWLDEELASTSVEDRLKIYQKYYGTNLYKLSSQTDQVRLITDFDGDGRADKAEVFATGFNNVLDGIASGVLPRKNKVWFTDMPNLWQLEDKNQDGKADVRKVLQTGYGVRVGFLGHDLHGLRFGPDGRLYFTVGDRGMRVTQGEKVIQATEYGAVLRCNPDGSDLEIFAIGLRNPQELAFDNYGNLFTGDNNSDGGDRARWVHLVEGGDSGWRLGFQFINDPNSRGIWNSEKMWHPRWEGQAAHIIPPVINIANGPSGLTYYPGIGLPTRYKNHFFLSDFRGSSANSVVHSFTLRPKGATFELLNREDLVKGLLTTDVEMGYDGSLYILDWVETFNKQGKGRIYRVFDEEMKADPRVEEVRLLFAEGFEHRSTVELAKLLKHDDQRVRQEAQFELADRKSIEVLSRVFQKSPDQLGRIHALWGLEQIHRAISFSDPKLAKSIGALVLRGMNDTDNEIVAQSARVSGEMKLLTAGAALQALVQDASQPRIQFFAAQSLGKLGQPAAGEAILNMLRSNDDRDTYLRHAGVMALVAINNTQLLEKAETDGSASVRLASLLAYRRLENPAVERFLKDLSPRIVFEAASAINDASIYQGEPALARLLEKNLNSEPLLRRVINANYRIGTSDRAEALGEFATRSEAPDKSRTEAITLLGQWEKPSGRDQVTGLWRPLEGRSGESARQALAKALPTLLKSKSNSVLVATARAADRLGLKESASQFLVVLRDTSLSSDVRLEALKTIATLDESLLAEAIEAVKDESSEALRSESTRLQGRLKTGDGVGRFKNLLESGSTGEKQAAVTALTTMSDPGAVDLLAQYFDLFLDGKVAMEIQLELTEAATKTGASKLQDRLKKLEQSWPANDPVAPYKMTLSGGNAAEGRKIFLEKAEASCQRCHKVGTEGGDVGPDLTRVGTEKTRDYILESLVAPNAKIAQGFETTLITMKSGENRAGIVKSETADQLVLNSPEEGLVTIKKSEIQARDKGLSGMLDGLGQILTKRELRDLVEFLASQK